MPIVNDNLMPVIYPNWEAWRVERLVMNVPQPLIVPDTSFCGVCWGQGRLWELAANGEGYIPRPCVTCAARGTVTARCSLGTGTGW